MVPLQRLTTDMASVKTTIDSFVATGNTNIPLGLAWGWHTLSPTGPFGDGVAYGTPKVRKIIILMTDGQNTSSVTSNTNQSTYSGLGYIWQNLLGMTSGSSSARTTRMDQRLAALCSNIKAQNITIYTVRVEDSSGSSSLLQTCASSPDKFYDVQTASQLNATFAAIAGSIDDLRIAR
jgi:Mg-chelatase subunit ChlD